MQNHRKPPGIHTPQKWACPYRQRRVPVQRFPAWSRGRPSIFTQHTLTQHSLSLNSQQGRSLYGTHVANSKIVFLESLPLTQPLESFLEGVNPKTSDQQGSSLHAASSVPNWWHSAFRRQPRHSNNFLHVSGLSVRIQEKVGKRLSEAVCQLARFCFVQLLLISTWSPSIV
jgi:hypothetical protein